MAEAKTCPKCNGAMTQGKILKTNEYTARGQYIHLSLPRMMSRAPIFPKYFPANRFQIPASRWWHFLVKVAAL